MEFSFEGWLAWVGRTHSFEEPARGPGFKLPEAPFKNCQSDHPHGARNSAAKSKPASRRATKSASLSQDEWVKRSLYSAFSDAKKRAKLRGDQFSLSEDCIQLHLDVVGACCSLTGIPFRRIEGVFRQPFRPSFDRINSKSAYTPDNTRIVACCVNAAMNEWGVAILDTIARGRCARLAESKSDFSLRSLKRNH